MHFNPLLTYFHYFVKLYYINILIFINNIMLIFILIISILNMNLLSLLIMF